MQGDSSSNDLIHHLLHRLREPSMPNMLGQDTLIDGPQSFSTGEVDCKHSKMALKPGVNGETAGRRVHAGDILDIANLLESQLLPIVPMLVVQVLLDKCVGLDCAIGVHSRHVHVIYEVNEFLAPRWAKVAASFLLKGLLHDTCCACER